MAIPKGRIGDWFATWKGESLPCVHKRWTEGSWPWYADPEMNDKPKWIPFVSAIETGLTVILTNDNLDENGSPASRISGKNGYISLWRIEDISVSDSTLRFKFVEKLDDFR